MEVNLGRGASMGTFLHDYGVPQYGHAQGFHVSTVLNGAAWKTYRHDYGVPNTGTLRAFM